MYVKEIFENQFFTLEMLESRGLAADRAAVHKLVQATTLQAGRHLLEPRTQREGSRMEMGEEKWSK